MNDPRTQLKDLIHVEKGIIPANLCDHIISDIETREWKPHTWYNAVQGSFGSEETMELDVQGITPELQQLLTPIMIQAGAAYNQKYAYLRCERTRQIMNRFSTIRFNRYSGGQIMTTGDSNTFGDLANGRWGPAGTSNGHGGLG